MNKKLFRHFTKEYLQITNKCMKIYLASLMIKEMQTKKLSSITLFAPRKVKIENIVITKCWLEYGATTILIHCW